MRGGSSGAGHSALSGGSVGGHLSQTDGGQTEPDPLCGDHLHEQEPGDRIVCGGDRYVGHFISEDICYNIDLCLRLQGVTCKTAFQK